jgi:transposase
LIDAILEDRPHPEQGFRSAIGILGLAKRHGPERVDAACARAIALGTRSYGSVARILGNRAEALAPAPADAPALIHANIRGPAYYH